MKLIAGLSCYNEAIFLDYSIRSIYDHVDEIILTDCAMRSARRAGFTPTSSDGTKNVLDRWVDNKKVFLIENKIIPDTFGELLTPSYNLARDRGATWYFNVGADEIWPKNCLKILKNYLLKCERQNILGLNVWMHHFAPDFWHSKDFRNPRLSQVTKYSYLCEAGDGVIWPEKNLYQFAGDCETFAPAGTPDRVLAVNADLPKALRAFHYSCVGESRVQFKVDFYQKRNGTYGDRYNEAYVKKNWDAFKEYGFKNFTGKHPEVMLKHPLYNEKLY